MQRENTETRSALCRVGRIEEGGLGISGNCTKPSRTGRPRPLQNGSGRVAERSTQNHQRNTLPLCHQGICITPAPGAKDPGSVSLGVEDAVTTRRGRPLNAGRLKNWDPLRSSFRPGVRIRSLEHPQCGRARPGKSCSAAPCQEAAQRPEISSRPVAPVPPPRSRGA